MPLHEKLQNIFSEANPVFSVYSIGDIKNILYGHSRYTVYAAAELRRQGLTKAMVSPAFDFLADELLEYVTNRHVETQLSFDHWHDNTCKSFLARINPLIFPNHIEYGKAQKCVNIALKYLYCCNDAPSVFPYRKFDFAHVALDGFTYNSLYMCSFFRDYVEPIMCPGAPFSHTWSGLTSIDYYDVTDYLRTYIKAYHPHTFNDYLNASRILFPHVMLLLAGDPDEHRPLTPFEAEFFIWELCKNGAVAALAVLF